MSVSSVLRIGLLSALAAVLTGCAMSSSAPSGAINSVAISGRVHGGQQPVSGATIQLYAVGTSGDGSASTPLLTQTVISGSDGTFSITSLFSCNSATLVYLTAIGGNPGIGSSNQNLALMTALGPCTALTTSTFIQVNEVTTVAAVNALAPFMSSETAIGSSLADSAALNAAFALASQFADPTAGTSPGNNVSSGTTIPSTLINTLANIIAACINSAGGTSITPSVCGELFSFTTAGNVSAPTDTIGALLALANNPSLNTAALYGLIPASVQFQPSLSSAPSDFRIRPGQTVSASLQVTPSQLIFPTGAVGIASSPQTVTVQNISASSATLGSLTFTGANASNFAQTNNCPATLSPSASCTVQITLTPSATGPRIGYLSVASSTSVTPQFVALTTSNPVPTLTNLSPNYIPAGGSFPYYVQVLGSNFVSSSIIQVNGSNRLTGHYNTGQLQFLLTSADQAAAGTLSVTVVNPTPGGGTSTAATFTITVPAGTPSITSTYPTSFITGGTNNYIQVFGTNLVPGSIVQWNGANLTTSYAYSPYYGYYLVGYFSPSLLASPGTVSLTVDNLSVNPPLSNLFSVTIANPPPPVVSSLSTNLIPTNQASTITLSGSGFTANCTVTLNGIAVPFTFNSSTQISLNIPASTVITPGIASIVVSNPYGTAAPQYVTAYVAIINNSMVYNPVNGLFYLSVPSYAGTPYANSIVSVDPVTGVLGTPISVGSEPNRMAISSDGRYLWVALDGAGAVRQVDLVAGTAGLQFSVSNGPSAVASLAALPGVPNSVIVCTYYSGYTTPTGIALAIYDNGVPRSSIVSFNTYAPFPWAMVVNPATNEIYGPGGVLGNGGYTTYTYNSNGVTAKFSSNLNLNYAANNTDDIQLANGNLYTSSGLAVNPETGALVGTFYTSGTTVAQGSISVDTSLGKAFILENENVNFGTGPSAYQIGAFNLSDYTATAAAPIQIYSPESRGNYQYQGPTGPRLTRWGSNGLAFHGTGGFVSLRTSLVQDLSTTNADLAVALTSSGPTTTGNITTYTATVTNNGPSSASSVDFTAFGPSTGILISATPSTGSCSIADGPVECDLGAFVPNGSATVIITVQQLSAGSSAITGQVSASENDPNSANNQATSTVSVTGSTYSVSPTLSSISPAAIASGSGATTITLSGTGFNSASTAFLNGIPLPTTYTGSTTLMAVVPPSDLANLGWAAITVSTPAPGGGTSPAVPLTIFSVLNLGANHILYDPYSRNIMASIGTGTSSVAANSILAVNPSTASVGTPVPIGGTPTSLALTSDGQILYSLLPGTTTGSIARFNMLTQQPDFTVSGFQATGYGVGISDIATMPGTENTVAVYSGEYVGDSIIDFNPTQKTAAQRGVATGIYTGGCSSFLNATDLIVEGMNEYTVTSTGFSGGSTPSYTALGTNIYCYKLAAGVAYGQSGLALNLNVSPAVELGTFENAPPIVNGIAVKDMEPDPSLNSVFYATSSVGINISGSFDSITTVNPANFAVTSVLPVPFAAVEGSTSGYTLQDIFRWGQDGIAVLSSSGRLYLLRGPSIVPQLLNVNSPATLSSSSTSSLTHGSGNALLTLTGSNFIPGVAVMWNGSYRTTSIVDATHVTVAIPASDLTAIGSASLVAVNPGAPPSGSLMLTVN